MVHRTARGVRYHRQALFVIAALSTVATFGGCRQAPLDQAQTTWDMIQDCERQGGTTGAPPLASAAQACYDSAWQIIDRENRRLPFMRGFARAESLLSESAMLADSARRVWSEWEEQREQDLGRRLRDLQAVLASQGAQSTDRLGQLSLRRALTLAELRLATAASELKTATPEQVQSTLGQAEEALAVVHELLERERELSGYDSALSRHWLRQTVEWSANTGRCAFIVVKTLHKAYIVQKGVRTEEFSVDLGFNSGMRKLHSGDAATPEGIYEIVNWRDNGSNFYKSLDLNYPNAEDRRRFGLAWENGRIPNGVGIGDAIGVHGDGGVGDDWTDGCVALSNEDMDRLMELMTVGDRVTIVRHIDGWQP
jgi:hypothetical protein